MQHASDPRLPIPHLTLAEGEMKGERFVGIDLGVRTMEVRILDQSGAAVARWHGNTSMSGRGRLMERLRETDRVGIEACALGFVIARQIIREVGAEVCVLNSTRMYMIFRSVKKTDSEDAMKIARLLSAYPPESLPTVAIPSETDERNRALVSELQYLAESRCRYVNRLHSVFVRQGITTVTKADLKTEARRGKSIDMLDTYRKEEALRLHRYMCELEHDIRGLEETEREYLAEAEESKYVLSIPGVGPKTAMAFCAHIGNGERFTSRSQVSGYVGFVPRVDQSGATAIYGRIHKRGCSAIRRVYVQAAWAFVRSAQPSPLKMKYEQLRQTKGRKKAIVAIARRMLELSWTLVQKQELYMLTDEVALNKKLNYYKIRYKTTDGGRAA